MNNRLIKSNDAGGGGGCTNTVDLYNPFPDGGGLALYQLNGDATDVSGNYDGTATDVTYGTGVFGQAGVFNGSSSRITTVASQLPIPASGAFTVSFWAKVDSSLTLYNTCMLSFGDFWLKSEYLTGRFGLGDINVGYETTTSMGYGWNHCVLTVDASNNINLYLNGVNEFTGNKSISRTNGGNFAIGVARLSIPVYYFNGSIDQVRIFNRALRPYEVEALYTEEYCTPTIVPSQHFNTVLYSGNDSVQAVTGVGFQPDWVWLMGRNVARNYMYSEINGNIEYGVSSSTAIWEDAANALTSFDSDGFTLGDNFGSNEGGINYVAWNFKAGGAAVTNTDGTITSQVSANTEAGFSIVSYTGNGTEGATVGHGLSAAPKIVIVKYTSTTGNWWVQNVNLGVNSHLQLNSTAAENTSAESNPFNNSYPTDNVFTVGSTNVGRYANAASTTAIAYCFAEVEGFSSFGSYVGTGASGNTVVTGFEPAFVMVKITSGVGDWWIFDNKRTTSNPRDLQLRPNSSAAESNLNGIDFLENGFNFNSALFNDSGVTFIYMAFAADPTAVEPTLEDSFNTVLYTGNGGTQSVTGVGFQPDFTWIKPRQKNYGNIIFDSVRGAHRRLFTYTTTQEGNDSPLSLISFDSNGFTVGDDGLGQYGVNGAPGSTYGGDYVAWNWKGAEIPAINSNGSIPSVVSANPAAGFSIVSWNGNSSTATIGHGLGSAPKMIITKARNVAGTRWNTFHASVGTGKYLSLNTTDAATSFANAWPTLPDENVWYMSSWENYTGENYISYCFAEVPGFSKFGSYVGNGLPLGPTIDLGFEPAFVMVKRTNAASGWRMIDNKRFSGGNKSSLEAQDSSAEQVGYIDIDFNATNFTINSTNVDFNAIGGTYIYMAFANQF